MSQTAIAEIVKMMESVPEPVQARAVEYLRDYLHQARTLRDASAHNSAHQQDESKSNAADSEFARAVLALPSLPHRNAGVVTSAYIRQLLESET